MKLLVTQVLALALAASPTLAQDDAGTEATPPEENPPPRAEARAESAVRDPAPPRAAGCAERAYPIARASVVRVESGGRRGAGVITADPRHVATAIWIVEHGHGIDITDVDGNRRHARIVLTSDSDGLALLELDSALPGPVLSIASWDQVPIGAEVVVVGVPNQGAPRMAPESARGTAPWAASTGIVASRSDRALQTDAAIGAPIGSPIVDCEGALIGIVGRRIDSPSGAYVHMPAAPAIVDLASRAEHPEGYGGRWALTGGLALGALYEDPQWLLGGSLSIGVIALDSVILAARAHYYYMEDSPLGSDVLSQSRDRFRGDAFLAWRQILVIGSFAMHFELGAGASVTRTRERTRHARIEDDGAGNAVIRWRETSIEGWSVRPLAILNLLHGPVVISYALELDVDRLHLTHVFGLGARM